MRVLLVNMPFAPVDRPSLGLSLLKARLLEGDVACDVAYLNLAFAATLGREDYERVVSGLPSAVLCGEWVFTECLYDGGKTPPDSYVDDILRDLCRLGTDDVEVITRARASAPRFLAEAFDALRWSDYDVVGFASSGPQNLAALALAKRVKDAHPEAYIAFGGHNWESVMGRELHRRFPFVDVACRGEADLSFPALVGRLADGGPRGFDDIPGVVYRDGRATRATPAPAPLADLDGLPMPDFSDYFASLSSSGLAGQVEPTLPVEASRGCWWAARRPCLFCGVNGPRRVYRAKSPARVVRELRELARAWPCGGLDVVDHVVSPGFLSDVIPQLAADPLPAPLSFEVRPGIGLDDVQHIAAAGASIQSGIESLSDSVLRRVRKGTTVLENIRLLRACKAGGVAHVWNLLYGFPGETPGDYEETFALLPAVRFLDPPHTCGPLVLERFSPYYERSRAYGLRQVAPDRCYRYLYPFPPAAVRNIAYFFEYSHPAEPERPGFIQRLRHEVETWQRDTERGEVTRHENEAGALVISDTRPAAPDRCVVLDDLGRLIYEACDDIRSRRELFALAGERGAAAPRSGRAAPNEEVDRRLSEFVARRLMVASGDRFLSLALPQRTV